MQKNLKIQKASFISFIWGFSEATFFFIVPDVWLSFCSIKSWKTGLKQIVLVLVGALIGGSCMYFLGSAIQGKILVLLDYVPMVNRELIHYAINEIFTYEYKALFYGPIQGIPYKIYASASGLFSLNYWTFLLVSVPVRSFRFIVSVVLSNFISSVVLRKWSLQKKRIVLILAWVIIYCFYFYSINSLDFDFFI